MPKFGQIEQTQIERFNTKRAWFRNAYRIVDAAGVDMIQPYALTRGDARAIAADLDITLVTFPADTLDSYDVTTANGITQTMTGHCLLWCFLRSIDDTVVSWRVAI